MEERQRSLSEVAGLMGVSERTVRRWIKSGKLRAYKPGRDYRIPESAVRDLVEGSEISPKALAPPSLFNGLEDERRAEWENTVSSAHQLREHGQERVAELLAAWQESKDHEKDPAKRRPYLDEIGELLQEAYDVETALVRSLPSGWSEPEWEEVREASRFYGALVAIVEAAGLHVRRNARPHRVENAA